MGNDIGWCISTKDQARSDIGWCISTKDVEARNDNEMGKHLLPFFLRRNTKVKFHNNPQFVYIDIDYLKVLSEADSEIFYDEENNYDEKPHLGILLNNEGREYVIPLTSAKEKHKIWDDVAAGWYRIYEIINIKKDHVSEKDIIVNIKNQNILKDIPHDELEDSRQRILSVLDIRKMFPVKPGVYTEIDFRIKSSASKSANQKIALMMKEYFFIRGIEDKVEEKAAKIYKKQIEKNKVLKYHCNYKKLEEVSDNYEIKKK